MVLKEEHLAGLQHADTDVTLEDYAECRRIMREASQNYSFASNVLPPEKLPHVEALYAFLRVGDDRVDVSHEGFASRRAAIDNWQRLYDRVFEMGHSEHPVMRAYYRTAQVCDIPRRTMDTYFRAMTEDLTITRFSAFDDLVHYMEGSAIPVGRAMVHILGIKDMHTFDEVYAHADSLSIAMQLSNFWRDVGYDWNINRIYIPQEDLDRFCIREDDIAAGQVTDKLIDLLEYQIERTERYYRHAEEGIPMLASGQWGVRSGLEIYRAILHSIRRNGYDVFTKKAGANRVRMLGLVIKSWWNTRRT